MASNKTLDTYIKKLMEMQSQKSDELSNQEMREVALQTGMSVEDLVNLEQFYLDHIMLGKTYMRNKNWKDAVEEFEEIRNLKTKNVELLSLLASSHCNLYIAEGSSKNQNKAQEYAKQCLELSPRNATAHKVITALRKKNKSKGKIGKRVLMGIALLVLFAIWYVLSR